MKVNLPLALTALFLGAALIMSAPSHAESIVRAAGAGVVEPSNAPKAVVKRTKSARAKANGSASMASAPKASVKVRK